MALKAYFKTGPSLDIVMRYAELCEPYRRLPIKEKLYEMAEKLLQIDIRIIKMFNARATVALAKIVLTRLAEIGNLKDPSEDFEHEPDYIDNPYHNKMPLAYSIRCPDNIYRELLWLTDFYR